MLVSRCAHGQVDPDSLCPDDMFIEQMGSLLDDDEHCDVTFFVGPSRTEVGLGWIGSQSQPPPVSLASVPDQK